MRKLKLDMDQLTVESFDASPGPDGEGTVLGHLTQPTMECGTDCMSQRTVQCGGECNTGAVGYTCNGCATNRDVCGGWEGGTMNNCTYAPTMNPALFDCYSMAYCIATKPCE
jgi:hypothetical protein